MGNYLNIRTNLANFNKESSYHVVKDNGIRDILDDEDIIQVDTMRANPLTFAKAKEARDEWQALVAGEFAKGKASLTSDLSAIQVSLDSFNYSSDGYGWFASCNSYEPAADALDKIFNTVQGAYRVEAPIRSKFGQAYVEAFTREESALFTRLDALETRRSELAGTWALVGAQEVFSVFGKEWWSPRATICSDAASVITELQL